ncbi:MAG: hypothetical protein KDB04_10885 [Acidimicrobiales bacterium]|nr:hypothetical protein [Acidimicrobiales bacterium]HRW39261.1 hypothetical protein [Aquihabitans sp.]
MGWFARRKAAGVEHEEHEEPVVIDLGLQKGFEVEYQVSRLHELGLEVFLLAQSENPRLGDLFPKHCRLYVPPADVPRVRAELEAVGLL